MNVISVNVGLPEEVEWQSKLVTTSIFKSPVFYSCKVSFLNIEGDYQSDQEVHGGVDKAVYSYDYSYYDYWEKQFERDKWEYGLFGENLTTTGLTDDVVRIGNIYEIGTVKLQAVQPRFPCFKLCIRFGRKDMIDRFYNGIGFGVYYRVIEEGSIKVNDEIKLIEEYPENITIKDLTFCKTSKGKDQNKLQQILSHEIIPNSLKQNLKMYLL